MSPLSDTDKWSCFFISSRTSASIEIQNTSRSIKGKWLNSCEAIEAAKDKVGRREMMKKKMLQA
jgi:hypothetical protein